MKDTGKAGITSNWEKAARRSREEEQKEAKLLLGEPETDGDRVLLLAQ